MFLFYFLNILEQIYNSTRRAMSKLEFYEVARHNHTMTYGLPPYLKSNRMLVYADKTRAMVPISLLVYSTTQEDYRIEC